jgi:hypothetical protein
MANNNSETERRLWSAADEFRANSELKSSEYATPVLGLIFLRYADHRFTQAERELEGKGSRRRAIGKEDYQAKGVMFLPPKARFSYLLALPEGENIGKSINEAMKAVEADNEELKGVLPRTYTKIDNLILASLLKNFSQIAVDAQGDKFGKIALDKVQKGKSLSKEEFKSIKAKKLIEGRRPNVFVSAEVAAATDNKEAYIRNRAFDKGYYRDLVVSYLEKYTEATRPQIDRLLQDKLSDALDDKQKKQFVTNLLQEMKRENMIEPDGTTRWAKWRMFKPAPDGEN